jgi:hypothetical protein
MLWIMSLRLRTSLVVTVCIAVCSTVFAGDHEAHFNPAEPRPDFSSHRVYNAWVPYRKVYNRPTYIGGRIAAVIEPTSQEAMSWRIHNANGDYECGRPGCIPMYNYPKPWEVMAIHPRPNTPLATTE